MAAQGPFIVMANRISRDGGATWTALDPRLGAPLQQRTRAASAGREPDQRLSSRPMTGET